MKKLNNKSVGIVCMILGALFFLGGIIYFIMLNFPNTYSQKVEATIVSRFNVTSEEDDVHTLLELAYKVGDETLTSPYTVYEELPEDQMTLEVYYNIKNPTELVQAGWHFEPIVPAAFGILIFLTGLTYMGKITLWFDISGEKSEKIPEWDKKYYEAKERMENALFPIVGLLALIGFGIFILVSKKFTWSWVFIGVGGIGIIYFLSDFIPAIVEYTTFKRIKQFKVHALSVDDDFEQFEKQQKEKESQKNNSTKKVKEDKADNTKENTKDKPKTEIIKPEDFVIEDTIEIKSLDIKKKKKK